MTKAEKFELYLQQYPYLIDKITSVYSFDNEEDLVDILENGVGLEGDELLMAKEILLSRASGDIDLELISELCGCDAADAIVFTDGSHFTLAQGGHDGLDVAKSCKKPSLPELSTAIVRLAKSDALDWDGWNNRHGHNSGDIWRHTFGDGHQKWVVLAESEQ